MIGKIALEEHFLTPEFNPPDVNLSGPQLREIQRRLLDLDEERIEGMDENGIEMALLSLNSPGIQAETDPIHASQRARRANDDLAKVIARFPARYAGFAAVPMQDPRAAAAELSRCITDLGFKGAMIHGYSNVVDPQSGEYLDEPRCLPFWERAAELGVPVYLHPRNLLPSQLRIYDGHPELMAAVWAFTVETATHALRIITSGLFDRYPGLQMILGHMGETLPFHAWRTDYSLRMGRGGKELSKTVGEYLSQNFYFTTAGNFSTVALMATMLAVGTDRIMFSVDYPWASMVDGADWFDRVPISEPDR
ncbi:MAG: amidohydrolase family protein, partial [Candidatus Dormibacteria bacterium]